MNDIAISLKQIDDMKHAIGFKRSSVKIGKYEAYRNYYSCSDNASWNQLVRLGLATCKKGSLDVESKIYFVTREGMNYLEKLLDITITEGD